MTTEEVIAGLGPRKRHADHWRSDDPSMTGDGAERGERIRLGKPLMPSATALSRTAGLTAAALSCFAANSLLCRAALRPGLLDAATFTSIRLISGAVALALIVLLRHRHQHSGSRSVASGFLLFTYAGAFSLAYVRIGAGVGALLLFGAVQVTMLGWTVARGSRPAAVQWVGIGIALAGLACLTVPGASAPDPIGAVFMLTAGIAWGAYSLRGRLARDPLTMNADNFLWTIPFTVALSIVLVRDFTLTTEGALLAAASGVFASAGGYSLWYEVLPTLGATRAAAIQLAVPVLAGVGATVLLGEPLTSRIALSGVGILVGIALTLRRA